MTGRSVPGVASAAATAAVLVLALLSRGDALVLAVLLVIAARRLTALAVLPGLVAVSWRWGSSSLDAWAGAQAVLGPAGVVGPARAAAACWLAGAAVVLATPDGDGGMGAGWGGRVTPNQEAGDPAEADGPPAARQGHTGVRHLGAVGTAMATGAACAVVVAGPALGGEVWIRVVATVVGALAAAGIRWVRGRRPSVRRVGDVLIVAAGLGALALASTDAPAWSGTIDADAAMAGVLVAAAVAAVVAVAAHTVAALRLRRA